MEELLNFGPLVISFEPTYDFMHYNSGIYHSVDANEYYFLIYILFLVGLKMVSLSLVLY